MREAGLRSNFEWVGGWGVVVGKEMQLWERQRFENYDVRIHNNPR
jgi:hypothetical protein